jgi:hypothetical protein
MVLNQRMVRFCRQATQKTVQEMQTYAWDSKAAQRGEEKPLKVHDQITERSPRHHSTIASPAL